MHIAERLLAAFSRCRDACRRPWRCPGLSPLGVLALLLALPAPARAAEFFVSGSGNDAGSGAIDAPFRSIGHAVDRLSPGDTLSIRGGVYHERVRVRVSGTDGAPITIRSYPGETATIDSGPQDFRRAGNADWELVDEQRGEYRSVRTFQNARVAYAYVDGIADYRNGRVGLVPYKDAESFRSLSEDYVDETTPIYVGPGTFYDSSDQRVHIRLAKTADFRSVESRYGAILAGDRPDPRNHSIILSVASYSLDVAGSYLTFKDLTINQAAKSVVISEPVHHLVFDGITVWIGAKGILSEAPEVHDVSILRSRLYGDSPSWIFWSDIKDKPFPAELMRVTSLDLRAGAHHWDIAYNHIRGSGQDLVSTNNAEHDIAIHHNRLENCGDDALEIEGTENVGRIEIYENFILNCLVALAPGQDTARFDGPLLFYRNVVSLLRNPSVNRAPGINRWNGGTRLGFHTMFKNGASAKFATRNTHVYQNTLLMLNSSRNGINPIPRQPDGTTVANNIMIMINARVTGTYRLGVGQVVDGNLYWKLNSGDRKPLIGKFDTVALLRRAKGIETHGLGDTPQEGTDPLLAGLVVMPDPESAKGNGLLTPASETPRLIDFALKAESPAIGAGILLSSRMGNLPDTRRSRDIGAIPADARPGDYAIFPFDPKALVR